MSNLSHRFQFVIGYESHAEVDTILQSDEAELLMQVVLNLTETFEGYSGFIKTKLMELEHHVPSATLLLP